MVEARNNGMHAGEGNGGDIEIEFSPFMFMLNIPFGKKGDEDEIEGKVDLLIEGLKAKFPIFELGSIKHSDCFRLIIGVSAQDVEEAQRVWEEHKEEIEQIIIGEIPDVAGARGINFQFKDYSAHRK